MRLHHRQYERKAPVMRQVALNAHYGETITLNRGVSLFYCPAVLKTAKRIIKQFRKGELMIEGPIWIWIAFNVFVLAMLALDLGVFHRHSHAVSVKEALTWSVVWIGLAMCFNTLIYFFWDSISPGSVYTNQEAALSFLTGYIIEKSLSVDNIFVFVLIFTYALFECHVAN